MPDRANLVVVVVGDVGLRCMLAARLSLLDVELLTASWYRQIRGLPLRAPAYLVMDEADLAGNGDVTIETLRREGRWQRLAILAAGASLPPSGDDWLIHVGKISADALLAQHIEQWTQSALSQPA